LALAVSLMTVVNAVLHPDDNDKVRKASYTSAIQFCATLGVSKADFPAALKEKLEEFLKAKDGGSDGEEKQEGNKRKAKSQGNGNAKAKKRDSTGSKSEKKRKRN